MAVWYDRIRDTTTTTGTGDITVSGSPPITYKTFSQVLSTNDYFFYRIVQQASNNVNEWEVGLGKYTGTNVFSRVSVYAGTNGTSLVSFSGGTKDVVLDLPANFGSREVLTADRTYYVRSDGSDTNSGLVNSSAGAFLTFAQAVSVVGGLDINLYNVTIQIGNAVTWTTAFTLNKFPITSGGQVILDLNGNSLSVSSGHAIVLSANDFTFTLQNGTVTTTGGGASCLDITAPGTCFIGSSLTFGATVQYHMWINDPGASIKVFNNYSVSGGGVAHARVDAGFLDEAEGATITFSGSPAFSGQFLLVQSLGQAIFFNNTFTNGATVTGSRCTVTGNSVVNTFGSTSNLGTGLTAFLPGNSGGTTATGGQFL